MSRPEHSFAPQVFYNEVEAKKYATSSRMVSIQREITKRAIELLNLSDDGPKFLLDVGCGSGLSGQVIADYGYDWIGLDISPSMLSVARDILNQEEASQEDDEEDDSDEEEHDHEGEVEDAGSDMEEEEEEDMDVEEMPTENGSSSNKRRGQGDVLLCDMGQGLPFRANSFDGCVSISAVQWLCNAYEKSHVPMKRLKAFFATLYALLRRGSRAVIQLYPETPQQMEMITHAAMSCGFTGGVVVDYPNSAKAKKFYLVLLAGGSSGSGSQQLPRALGTTESSNSAISYEKQRNRQEKGRRRDKRDEPLKKSRDWILKKKDRQRKQGREVRPDTKYTGRKRKHAF